MCVPLLRLPPMDLLRGFVAVGRRMSIRQAADDLCLSQSAVSKQISALEEALGVWLLKRGHRSIAFTPEGERLFRSADGALQQLQDVVRTLLVSRARKPVTITASIGVAGLWLLPCLGDFQLRHPEIDVRVAANNAMLDLRAEGLDLAIRYCASAQAPAGSVRLFGETVTPVASPSLGIASPLSKRSLADQFLLEFDDLRRPWLQWKTWLATMGRNAAKPKGILRFNQYDQVIHAAMAGQGIALGRLELLTPMLSAHRHIGSWPWARPMPRPPMTMPTGSCRSTRQRVVKWPTLSTGSAPSRATSLPHRDIGISLALGFLTQQPEIKATPPMLSF